MAENRKNGDETQSYVVLAQGTIVGHYRIIEKIGAGGMGEVFLAQDTELDRQVALKFLPPHLSQDEDCRARFKREAQAAAKLNHPNIVTIHEVSEYQGRPFFAMEHIEGKSLRDLIKSQELSLDHVIKLSIQMCEGLGKAHQTGITHRDIKPSNIVVDADGRPKLLDFGLAAVTGTARLTKTGSTLGTVGYMSPEQVQGRKIDQRSDLFSLGVVIYEMITGHRPFNGGDEAATLHAVTHDMPEPLARYKSEVPDDLQRIVTKLLEKDAALRYQNAEGVIPDLKHLVTSFVAAVGPQAPVRRKFWRVLLPTSMVVIVVLLALILKPWRISIQPTDVAEAVENRIAIMYFDNLAEIDDPQKLGDIATNLLISDLSQSEYVQVVSSQRLYDILKQLGREGEKKLDRSVATQVAKKAKARWMLTGSILQVQPQIVLTLQLADITTGSIVASPRIAGESDDDIFSLVDKLTVEIKGDLSLPAAAQHEPDLRAADITTESPEAYRYYLEAMDWGDKFSYAEFRNSLLKALEYDSTFAMAHARLSNENIPGLGQVGINKAMEYVDRVTDKEQLFIRCRYAAENADFEKAIYFLEKIIERYPDDKNVYHELGLRYWFLGQLEKTKVSFLRAIELDPFYELAYNNLAYLYWDIGNSDSALWAVNKYVELAPDEHNPYDSRGDFYIYDGKLDEAIASYQKALEIKPDYALSWRKLGFAHLLKSEYEKAEKCFRQLLSSDRQANRSNGRLHLASIPLRQGKFDEALAILEQGIGATRIDRDSAWEASMHFVKLLIYGVKGDMENALKEIQEVEAVQKEDTGEIGYRHLRVQLLAENGKIAEAERIAKELRQHIEVKGDEEMMAAYWYALGCIEFCRGTYELSRDHFAKAANIAPEGLSALSRRHVHFWLARACLEAGRLEEAVMEFEDLLADYAYRVHKGVIYSLIQSVLTHYYLGIAYEESGWTNKAIEQYETFLDIWKNADPDLESIEDAKARLARLKGI